MPRLRLSAPARTDLALILAVSAERWGTVGRHRYAALLASAMRKVAANPEAPATRDRRKLSEGIRSLHLRHARIRSTHATLRKPVHVLYYRVIRSDLVEIVRVLHERMDPNRHVAESPDGDAY